MSGTDTGVVTKEDGEGRVGRALPTYREGESERPSNLNKIDLITVRRAGTYSERKINKIKIRK